jgi:hypothetical protein
MAMNYRALTSFMIANFVVGQERARNISFQRTAYILLALIIFFILSLVGWYA